MKRLVFFDLDGTILQGLSSENKFIFYLLKKGWLGVRQIFLSALFLIRWFPAFKKQVLVKNKAYLTDLSVDAIQNLGKIFVKEVLLPHIRPTLQTCIDQHHQKGDLVFLLTGSPDFLAKEIAKYLNIDKICATECAIAEGKFLQDPPRQHPYGETKRVLAEKLCADYGVMLKDCVAYGNSIHDQFILFAVGHPIAVHPDHQLEKLAKENHWEILMQL